MVGEIIFIEGVHTNVDSYETADPQYSFLSEELRGWNEFDLFDRRLVFERKQGQHLCIGQPLVCRDY